MKSGFECKGGIKLEPRLQEYIKKLLFCKKNNITPLVPLEKEFGISSEDKKRIIAYKNGDRDLYSKKSQEKFDDDCDKPSFDFDPDEAFRSDPRFHRFAKKVKKDKAAMESRYNFGEFANEYESAFDPITSLGQNTRSNIQDQLLSKHMAPRSFNDSKYTDFRDYNLGVNSKMEHEGLQSSYKLGRTKASVKSPRVYNDNVEYFDNNYRPNISFKNRIYQSNDENKTPYDHNPQVTKIIGEMDSYRNQYDNHFDNTFEKSYNFDDDTKRAMPNYNSGKKNLDSSGYKNMPCFGAGRGMPDMDAACAMRGKSSREQSKILNKQNPFEHYFDYIGDDIQASKMYAPDRGISTRLDNHTTARPYMREVY